MSGHALTALSEDELMFKAELDRFAQEAIGPLVEKMDETEILEPSLLPKLFEMGLMGIEIPGEYGGADGNFFMAILAVESLAKVDPGVSVMVDVQNTLVNNVFLNFSNNEQQKKYLPMLASKKVGCYCLTEPSSGSDAFAMEARADDKGEHYILEGKKLFITNAKEAEIFIVFANIIPELGYKGITAFLVEKDMPGVKI